MLKIGSTLQIESITSREKLTSCKVQVYEVNKEGEEYPGFTTFVTLFNAAHELAVDLNVGDFIKVKDFGVSRNKSNGTWYTNINILDAEKVEGKVVMDDSPEELPFS